jgi:hypothetical protein
MTMRASKRETSREDTATLVGLGYSSSTLEASGKSGKAGRCHRRTQSGASTARWEAVDLESFSSLPLSTSTLRGSCSLGALWPGGRQGRLQSPQYSSLLQPQPLHTQRSPVAEKLLEGCASCRMVGAAAGGSASEEGGGAEEEEEEEEEDMAAEVKGVLRSGEGCARRAPGPAGPGGGRK